MQTNREDVGKRFLEIKIPIPLRKEISDKISEPYKDYFKSLNEIRDKLSNSLYAVTKKYTISDSSELVSATTQLKLLAAC